MLAAEAATHPESSRGMSVEQLEQTFPVIRLERKTVVPGKPFFIYRLVER
jgi:hypothetical protein